jgi:hypothetical protein
MLSLLLVLSLGLASADAADGTADEKTIKFIESFVGIPVDRIPPDRVNDFMKVDLSTLPKKLRTKAEARKFELHVLKQVADGKSRGMIRTPETRCAIDDATKSDDVAALKMAGLQEIDTPEEEHLEKETSCSERELMCEFSLQIVLLRDKKTGKPTGKRYFLHPNDPLMALVAAYRSANDVGGNTPFFGGMKPSCSH